MAGLRSRYLPKLLENEDMYTSSEEEDNANKKPLFVIDSKPDVSLITSRSNKNKKPDLSNKSLRKNKQLSSSLQPGILSKGYITDNPVETMNIINSLADPEKLYLENSVIKPGFEQGNVVPQRIGQSKQKKLNKVEREKTAGDNWFNMPAAEMTEENQRDLTILQMRDALDPKRFYKRNSDMKTLPKYFQIGTVVGTQADHYNSLSKKDRKNTLVDELLADAQFKKWSKKKYTEVLLKNPYYLRQKMRSMRKKKIGKEEIKKAKEQTKRSK